MIVPAGVRFSPPGPHLKEDSHVKRNRIHRLDGTEVLAYLFGPIPSSTTEETEERSSRADRNGLASHLGNLVEGELWTIREWLQTVWLERRCPASGQQLAECAESACRDHRQQEIPAEAVEAIQDLKQSRFVSGARPHLHELGGAVIARLRRVCDLLALSH